MARKKNWTPDQWEAAYSTTLDAIEREAEGRSLSFYRVAMETGVSQSILTRLRQRDGTLSTENLFRLLIFFDMLPAT